MKVEHNENEKVFFAIIDGYKATVEYQLNEGALDILHTRVPKELRGRGIASELVKEVYRYAEEHGLDKKAACPYAAKWLEANHRQ